LAPSESAEIVGQLEAGFADEWLRPDMPTHSAPVPLGQVLASLKGLSRCDEAALRLRIRTGLAGLPAAAPLEVPVCDRVRALLHELSHDEDWQGLARLAQRLLAVVALPRRMLDQDDLRVGGISDITNRGDVDRLLVSELVYDDLTLAIRIAMNGRSICAVKHRRACLRNHACCCWTAACELGACRGCLAPQWPWP
jgi:hypothetical protein